MNDEPSRSYAVNLFRVTLLSVVFIGLFAGPALARNFYFNGNGGVNSLDCYDCVVNYKSNISIRDGGYEFRLNRPTSWRNRNAKVMLIRNVPNRWEFTADVKIQSGFDQRVWTVLAQSKPRRNRGRCGPIWTFGLYETNLAKSWVFHHTGERRKRTTRSNMVRHGQRFRLQIDGSSHRHGWVSVSINGRQIFRYTGDMLKGRYCSDSQHMFGFGNYVGSTTRQHTVWMDNISLRHR